MVKKVLLYSGGMDSWLMDKLWKPDVKLFVDLGTAECKVIRKRLPKDVVIVDMPMADLELEGELHTIRLRNLILCAVAVNYGDTIAFGAIDGDVHYDGTKQFCALTQSVFNYVLRNEENKEVTICVPFRDYTKERLLREYIEQGGDIDTAWNETFSCYEPVGDKECGICASCKRKIQAFEEVRKEINNN